MGSATDIGRHVDELARALTERERRALLERIAKSLSIQDDGRRRIIHGELRQERRAELIAADMNRLGPWERLHLWFKRLISGRGEKDVFVRFRLGQSRDRVRAGAPHYVDFENRVFLAALPDRLRSLCRYSVATREFFDILWKDTDSLRRVLDYLLARRVPDAKRSLNQFCSTQEMQEIFRTTESRNQLKQLVLDRVSEYVDRIPPSVMEELEGGLRPLYLLKDLAMYDFDDFFVQFQSSESEACSQDDVEFARAAAHRVLDRLEELYLALYSVGRIQGEVSIFPEILNYYFAVRDGRIDSSNPIDIPESEEVPQLRGTITRVVQEARAVRDEVPLVDIVRYFRDDPYYRFLAYVPRLRLRDFYYSNLKIEVLQELDRRFRDLRMGVLGQLIQETFPQGLHQFEYFHPEIQSAIKRAGVGQLLVYRSLQVIQTFVQAVYRAGFLEFLRIIGKLMPVRGRQTGVDLTLNIAGLDDVAERLRNFDLSFAPDSDDGKTFHRFRYSSTDRDSAQISAFKALVNQKEREATIIIEKFQDQLNAVQQAFQLIKQSTHQQLNERYQTFENTPADDRPFDSRLNSALKLMENTAKILNQMIRIDHET
ncbi:MAG: DUF5312 family protein [Alkalispirochaeta sp.]